MLGSVVVILKKKVKASFLLKKLQENGLCNFRILQVNDHMHMLNKEDGGKWLERETKILETVVTKVRHFNDEDMVTPRVVNVECFGLPLNVWKKENLRAYIRGIREWIDWTYDNAEEKRIFNPVITLLTKKWDLIEDKLMISVKGKKYEIIFREKILGGKISVDSDKSNQDFDISKQGDFGSSKDINAQQRCEKNITLNQEVSMTKGRGACSRILVWEIG